MPEIDAGRDAVVSIILDGENAWEFYPQSGREFLRRLYDGIAKDPQMEAATIFTLCSLFGLRGGAACVVIADRFRNVFRPEGADQVLASLGAEAALALSQLDARKHQAGKKWYFPSLD